MRFKVKRPERQRRLAHVSLTSLCKDTLISRHALTSKAAREAETCARRASRTAAAAEASHDSLSMRCRSRSSSSHARAVCSCIRLTASVKAACSLHTSAYISIRQHMYSAATYACNGRSRSDSASPAVCIRQHTSASLAYVSIRIQPPQQSHNLQRPHQERLCLETVMEALILGKH